MLSAMTDAPTSGFKRRDKLVLPGYVTREWLAAKRSVNELVSALSEAGLELSLKREKKDFYAQLAETYLVPMVELRDRDPEDDEGAAPAFAQSGTPAKAASRRATIATASSSDPAVKARLSDSPAKFIDFHALATPQKNLPKGFALPPVHSCSQNSRSRSTSRGRSRSSRAPSQTPTEILAQFEGQEFDNADEDAYSWDTLEPAFASQTTRIRRSTGMASGMNDRSGRATTLSRPITSTATSKQTKKRASSAAKTDSKPFTFPSKFLSVASGLIALLAALAYASVFVIFWDQIGYRERGTPATVFPVTGNEGIDTLIRLAMPGLSKECPAGAVCFGKVVDGCEEPDHVIQYGALSRLVGPYLPKGWQFVVPFAGEPVCVEDKARLQLEAKKQTQVENLVAYLNDIVRKWTGSMLCGEANPDPDMTNLELSIIRDPKTRSLIGMPASSGKRQLRALVGTKWSDEKFEEYWNLVLFRLASHAAAGGQDPSHPPIPLRTVVDSATGRHRLLTTTSAPLLSFTCQARNTLWQAATRYYPHLLLSAFLLATLVVLNIRRAAAARDAHVAATLVEDILDALHAESENHRRDPLRHPVPGLALNALRDHFLRVCKTGGAGLDAYGFAAELDDAARTRWRVSDARVRDKVWGVVRAAVLRNACVRETVMEVGGEEDCVWQWIGSFALSPKKRKMVGERRQSGMVDASGDSVESRAALSKSKQAGGEDIVDVKKELFKQGEQGTRSSGNINYPSL